MNTLARVSSPTYTETELFSFLVQYTGETRSPIACWRLPDSKVRHLIVAEACQEISVTDTLEDLGEGFLTAPFDKNKNRFFLPADFFFSCEDGILKTDATSLDKSAALWLQEKIRHFKPQNQRARIPEPTPLSGSREKNEFIALIRSCLQEIGRGTFEKIVPSRTKHIVLPENFDIVHSFQKLCESYPQAFIFYVSLPGVGSWLGASPEVLVSVEDKAIFKTVALAGTLPYHEGLNTKTVAWTQKEIEEQALVERYVISCFKKIRVREYEEHGPKTVIAGNLMHLKSEFSVDMNATNFPQMGSVMLQLLHPTSAVCGMPLEASLKFLEQHEGYDRGFYAGYLGPVNIHNNVDLFVNLRCMQILEHRGILYAGAGVTIDSAPEEEWEETEMKLNTLLNVIL